MENGFLAYSSRTERQIMDLKTVPAWRVIGQSPNNLSVLPHPALRGAVAYYNFTFASGEEPPADAVPPLFLLPDASGCMVFSMGKEKEALFWGATTRTFAVAKDYEIVPMRFFVEFAPGGAHLLTGLYMKELADKALPAQDVHPVLYREIARLLDEEQDAAQFLRQLDALLLRQLEKVQMRVKAAFPLAFLNLLNTMGTAAPVRSLSDATGYSERHLARLFDAGLGVSAKACHRVLRINKAIGRVRLGISLTKLAQDCGYYDQAHFNHEFKAVCGVSPTAFLAAMADFYKEELKF